VVNFDDGTPAFAYGLTTDTHDNAIRLRKGDTYYDNGTNNQITRPGGN
jgi:hypothetical protein